MNGEYAVLNPWAEIDPTPLSGISPRVTELTGKTVGLFALDYKFSSRPILAVVDEKLKERFPTSKISWLLMPQTPLVAGEPWDTSDRQHFLSAEDVAEFNARFEDWVKGVDAAIIGVGD